MIEKTQINRYELVAAGRYTFVVDGRPEKKSTSKSSYRIWKLIVLFNDGSSKAIKVQLFPWESGNILKMMGAKKEGNELVWDDETVDGKRFIADLGHSGYEVNGEKRDKYTLSNFAEPEIPF